MAKVMFETEEEMWTDFELALRNIFKLIPLSLDQYMQIHSYVYKYCTVSQNYSDAKTFNEQTVNLELYTRVGSFLQNFLKNTCREARRLPEKDLLSFYTQKWHDYKFSTNTLDGLCSYVNRVWIRRARENGRKDIHEIATLAKIMWRDFVFLTLKKRIISAVLKLIERDRLEGLTNSVLVSRAIESLVELCIDENIFKNTKGNEIDLIFYKLHFEDIFIKTTAKFYTEESSHFLLNNSVAEYMKRAEERLQQEMKRVQTVLHPSTRERLEKTCEEVLIEKHVPVIQAEFKNFLDAEKKEDLSRMHLLLSKVPNGFDKLIKILDIYIGDKGLSAIENCVDVAANNPNLYVTTILTVYQKYNSLIQDSFNNNIAFVAVLDKAFARLINRNAVTKVFKSRKSSELLAKYCDFHLRMSSKNVQEVELEKALDQAITFFKYIDDKDIFLTFYSKLFARRLINQTSTSDDAEASMIAKLKQTCGFEYTSKLQRMFQDMGLSKELNEKFRNHLVVSVNPLDMDFNVQVLSNGFWPLKITDLMIPDQLQTFVQRFTDFYNGHFNGRKLQWAHSLSKGELHTTCFKQKYILQASTLQMSILLMFNTSLSYTVEQLADGTASSENLLIPLLQMLLKTKLILCDEGANLKLTSVIKLNKDYKNKKLKVNINVPLKVEQQAEQANTEKYIEGERNMTIQAAIVRIMKMRKAMKHQQLLLEVVNHVNRQFTPQIPMIKKAIEILLEKDYLERDDNQRDVLKYVA